jgi:hypothetical protein
MRPIKRTKENITEITCTAQENGIKQDGKKKTLRTSFASTYLNRSFGIS